MRNRVSPQEILVVSGVLVADKNTICNLEGTMCFDRWVIDHVLAKIFALLLHIHRLARRIIFWNRLFLVSKIGSVAQFDDIIVVSVHDILSQSYVGVSASNRLCEIERLVIWRSISLRFHSPHGSTTG